jgi:hypothetical protein
LAGTSKPSYRATAQSPTRTRRALKGYFVTLTAEARRRFDAGLSVEGSGVFSGYFSWLQQFGWGPASVLIHTPRNAGSVRRRQ